MDDAMPKLFIFAAIVALSLAAGRLSGVLISVRIREYEGLISDLKTAHSRIKLERFSFDKLLKLLGERGALRSFWDEIGSESANHSKPSAEKAVEALLVSSEEKAELTAYFASFGNCEIETELNKLELLISRIEESERKLNADSKEKIKLRASLFLLGGIALGLMLL